MELAHRMWDILCYQSPVNEVGRISNGRHPGNITSIIKVDQPFIPNSENNVMILQESFTSPVGSYIIFAPSNSESMNVAIRGGDSTRMHILPSGFVVCSNEKLYGNSKVGSLLTIAYQTLASSQDGTMMSTMEAVANANTLVTNTLVKVKEALKSCPWI
ncbi:hypothetical protein TSUD_146210 [Trifolium subterraneum]|uniref:HD-Zip IV C-terminal domain-containing protein n=1 Tax=Trifolium subterraneum TaxID=3900 RepID=A0A2Z6NNB0_TRISU|nr:hypothetical protein TSUD_146210 [Trifolium subterraneum]